MKGLLIKKDSELHEVILSDAKPNLEQMYKLIGTNIVEKLTITIDGEEVDLCFCEEGKLREKLPTLLFAKLKWNESGNEMDYQMVDYIAGNCLVLGFNDEGECISLTQRQINYIKRMDAGLVKLKDGQQLKVKVYHL